MRPLTVDGRLPKRLVVAVIPVRREEEERNALALTSAKLSRRTHRANVAA